MTATTPRFAALFATAISAFALQACSDAKSTEPAKPPVPSMTAASPLIQQGVVAQVAASAPTVRVTDASGVAVSGARVVFSGSTVFPAVFTGADGLATIAWKLTQIAGPQTITARLYSADGKAPLGPEITFMANAIPDAVAAVRAATDLAQVGFPLHAVATTPAVAVVDQFSNGEANVEVRFETTGGSTVSPASAITGANGVASIVEWMLGPDLGIDTLIARVGDLAPVYFIARASPTFHASAVVVANQTTCAISDGDVYCWGSNARGKVNVNAPVDAFTVPQRVPLPAKAASISGSYNHACAITDRGPSASLLLGRQLVRSARRRRRETTIRRSGSGSCRRRTRVCRRRHGPHVRADPRGRRLLLGERNLRPARHGSDRRLLRARSGKAHLRRSGARCRRHAFHRDCGWSVAHVRHRGERPSVLLGPERLRPARIRVIESMRDRER